MASIYQSGASAKSGATAGRGAGGSSACCQSRHPEARAMRRNATRGEPRRMNGRTGSRAVALRGLRYAPAPQGDGEIDGALDPDCERGRAFPRQVLPEPCCRSSPTGSQRAQGRPGAGGTRGPCAIEMHTGWTTGDAGRPAFPARMVLTVSFVLSPGSDALLPPSPCGWLMRAPGRAATSPQGLTHRPRASGPHDFSVRGRPHRNRRGLACAHPRCRRGRCYSAVSCAAREDSRLPALSSRPAPSLPRPPPPGPHIVTIANAPLTGQDARCMPQIRNSEK